MVLEWARVPLISTSLTNKEYPTMEDQENAVVVFTARSPNRIVREGGSQAWILNPARAKQCTYLVCTQNRNNPDHEFSDATEQHGSAFLIGKISAVRQSQAEGDEDRWMIAISEYALIDVPDVWKHWRNPVRYMSLDEMGIDPSAMYFHPMPPSEEPPRGHQAELPTPVLTIAEAKRQLAAAFGVKPDAVEITIRG
jgi:hypothetical protein